MALADFGVTDSRRTYAEADYTSKAGAELLKLKIEAYWRARGHVVQIDLREQAFHPTVRCARWDVRSTLVNGMPRKTLDALANQRI